MRELRDAVVFGGANGAGKTTLARQLLPVEHPGAPLLNADEIMREEGGAFATQVAAGKELLRRLDASVSAGRSFAIETTLSSRSYVQRMDGWRESGYRISLHFIELPSEDYAVLRVGRRVAAGGHAVPERDIRRRFGRGLDLFRAVYKPHVDVWYHWFSDEQGVRLVAKHDPSAA